MYQPSRAHLSALQEAARGKASFVVAQQESEAQQMISDAEVVMGNRYFLQSLPYAKKLKWMQSNSVGVDLILQAGERLKGLTLTCAKGVYNDEMADHAVALTLALLRQLHLLRDDQRRKRWVRRQLPSLSQAKVMILGWGGVGQAIARRLLPFGPEITGVRRELTEVFREDTGVTICGPDHWRGLLPETDILILALPLTQDTEQIVAVSELSALPSHALLVNVGRGETLHQEGLLEKLNGGSLGGAALDVVLSEPPGEDDPVWQTPRLLISPHVARSKETPPFRWEPLFVENLRRYTAGETLLNVVDIGKGY